VCTNLATDQEQTPLSPSAYLPEGEIELVEQKIDEIMKLLPEKQGFVLPGGTKEAAQAHVCRTVCRRAERRIVALSEVAKISPEVLQYVNRLSDYLFVLAKKINFNANQSEIVWQNVGR
jgi:cob(I)alamin adenosyltransferase